jgi:glycosyltransferase involved in cell wall biosynthesis
VTFIHFGQANRFRSVVQREERLTTVHSPLFTLFNNRQDGWSAVDWLARLRQVIGRRFDLVLGFGHKPNILLPARHCQFWHKSFVVADWCDLWGGAEGLIRQVILPSPDYRQRWLPTRLVRRTAFAIESRLERRFCRKSSAAITISRDLRERCLKQGIPEERVALVHSGCDTKRILPQNRIHCLADLEVELQGGPILGYIGNVHPDEAILLKAFAQICARRKDVTLLVAGADFQVDVAAVHGPEVAGRIVHLGRAPFARISRILGACDALLLPMADIALNRSRWPHKFTDYLAAARPVVGTKVGDTAGFIEKYETGRLAAPNTEDFAENILALLDRPEGWTKLGENARSLAEGDLSWETQLGVLEKFLAKLGAI